MMSHISKMFGAIVSYLYFSSRTLYEQPLYLKNATKNKIEDEE